MVCSYFNTHFTCLILLSFAFNLSRQQDNQKVDGQSNQRQISSKLLRLKEQNPEIYNFIDQVDSQCPVFACNSTLLQNQCATRKGIGSKQAQLHACEEGLSCDLMQINFLTKSFKEILLDESFFFNVNKKNLTLEKLKNRIQNWNKSIKQQFYLYEGQCLQRENMENSYQILDQFQYLILSQFKNHTNNPLELSFCAESIDFCNSKDFIPYSKNLAQECETVDECPYVIPQNLNTKTIGLVRLFQKMSSLSNSLDITITSYGKNEQIPKEEFGRCECGFGGKKRCSLTFGDR